MFAPDRETMMMVALVVSIAASFYMFNELKKQKQEISTVKNYAVAVSKKIPRVETRKPAAKRSEPEPEEDEEE